MIDVLRGRNTAAWGVLAAVLSAVAVIGVFGVAPEDADQGIIQKIFYFHVAIAIGSMVAFGVACVAAIRYLWKRQERMDEISSVSIGLGLLFSVLTVITGSIWAKASWGTWWVWEDPRLVTYLLVVLIYAAYFVLRSSADGERRMRYSAVFAVAGFAAVPLSFYSVRVAQSFVHPVVFTTGGAELPGSMLIWFVVSQAAVLATFVALLLVELDQRRADRALKRLKAQLEADAIPAPRRTTTTSA
jgi:heme exporter protein C